MARIADRYADNSDGPFFVDSDCIACDTCHGIAPRHFKLTSDHDHAIVFCQPCHPEEIALCEEALRCCPVEAIGTMS